MSKEKFPDKEPCNECKDKVYRVYVNSSKLGGLSGPYAEQKIVDALSLYAGFSTIQAHMAAKSAVMMPTPNSLIYSGDKQSAFNILDYLIVEGLDVSITDSKQGLK